MKRFVMTTFGVLGAVAAALAVISFISLPFVLLFLSTKAVTGCQ